jgi:hypothetical protein
MRFTLESVLAVVPVKNEESTLVACDLSNCSIHKLM